jgi:glycosyltransferase involved in cell wall biosynthesis
VFTVSEYSKGRISNIYKIASKTIGILPNAVTSTTKETINSNDKSKDSHIINLLYVSRLEQRKRYEWCLRAFEDLQLEGRQVSLTFVGRGSGDYANGLKKLLAQKMALHGLRLIHLEGISNEHLNITYANTDVFLFPSIGEGFGIPVIEAAAHGLPCVVTNSSALSELSTYYVGKAFEPENYLQFLNALKDVMDNLPIYKTRARMNVKKVVDHFSWETTAYQFLKSIIDLEK